MIKTFHTRFEVIVYDYSHSYIHLKLLVIKFLVAKDKISSSDA